MILKKGDEGSAVRDWQAFLVEKAGIALPISGTFDVMTSLATVRFQRKHGLPETGAVCSATLEKAARL